MLCASSANEMAKESTIVDERDTVERLQQEPERIRTHLRSINRLDSGIHLRLRAVELKSQRSDDP